MNDLPHADDWHKNKKIEFNRVNKTCVSAHRIICLIQKKYPLTGTRAQIRVEKQKIY
jgi:hypothetical protein